MLNGVYKLKSQSVYALIYDCLMQPSADVKQVMINDLYQSLIKQTSFDTSPISIKSVIVPGRPERPQLVMPKGVKKRSFSTLEGR